MSELVQKSIEGCSSVISVCAISAWIMDILNPLVIVLSIIWLGLQIWWFLRARYKEWRKTK